MDIEVDLDDDLVAAARELSGIHDLNALLSLALEVAIERARRRGTSGGGQGDNQ